eukprot:scaffold142103_cov26-Cyclotella_meneghiniana.AAC.1
MLCLNTSHDTCKALDANPSGCHKIHLISISHQLSSHYPEVISMSNIPNNTDKHWSPPYFIDSAS